MKKRIERYSKTIILLTAVIKASFYRDRALKEGVKRGGGGGGGGQGRENDGRDGMTD